MGRYRPRPTQVIMCNHCGLSFETRHKRTMYCGESCRQLAYQARHRDNIDQQKSIKGKGDLSFSIHNVGLTATGAAAAAVGNYLINDRPAQQAVLSKLDSIEKGTEEGLNQLLSAAQIMIDYINVQSNNDIDLKMRLDKIRVDRAEIALKKQQMVDKILAKRSAK